MRARSPGTRYPSCPTSLLSNTPASLSKRCATYAASPAEPFGPAPSRERVWFADAREAGWEPEVERWDTKAERAETVSEGAERAKQEENRYSAASSSGRRKRWCSAKAAAGAGSERDASREEMLNAVEPEEGEWEKRSSSSESRSGPKESHADTKARKGEESAEGEEGRG
jgi:hypothetical protein